MIRECVPREIMQKNYKFTSIYVHRKKNSGGGTLFGKAVEQLIETIGLRNQRVDENWPPSLRYQEELELKEAGEENGTPPRRITEILFPFMGTTQKYNVFHPQN